jgi:ABC-type glycerol-3-phosphate transport system permease component
MNLKILLVAIIILMQIIIHFLAAFRLIKKRFRKRILILYIVSFSIPLTLCFIYLGIYYSIALFLLYIFGLIIPGPPMPGLITCLYGWSIIDLFEKAFTKIKNKIWKNY